ncbi:MAG: acetate--CoA ligase family protein, partial [Beijerinckiaceae bacterium]
DLAGRRLTGNRIAVVTSTGGAATLVSDSLGEHGLETPEPDEKTAAALRALQPGDGAVFDRNPIDVTLAGLQPDILGGVVRALLDSPAYDGLVIIVGSSGVAAPDLMANAIEPCLASTSKPVIAYVSPHAPEASAQLTARNVPAYTRPESCGAVLAALLRASAANTVPATAAPSRTFDSAALPPGVLDEAKAKALFAAYGIPGTREHIVATATEAQAAANVLGGKVALKVLSSAIAHKSDVGGVALGLDAQSIASALEEMRARIAAATGQEPQTFLVQEMAGPGIELILGLKSDALGKAVLLGAGGTAAELSGDTVLAFVPPSGALTREQAMAMAKRLKIWPLLNGYRGKPKADIEALADAIVAFSEMVQSLGDRLGEAEINPLIVLREGVCAADGLAVIATTSG